MAFEFKLPDVGEGIHEGEIVRWLVAEGDVVAEDQPLVEVQTDKAVVEIPSPVAGRIARLHFKDGDVVEVGSVLVTIEESAAGRTPPQPAGAKAEVGAGQAALATTGAAVTAAEVGPDASDPRAAASDSTPRRRVLATPATRRLARELGVDLEQVPGSGPGGRVTDEDVRAFAAARQAPSGREAIATGAAAKAAAPSATTAPTPARTAAPAPRPAAPTVTGEATQLEERIPLRGVRKRIAEQMVTSKYTAPHVTVMDEVDVTELVRVREGALPLAAERGIKLTYLPFMIKAVIAGLREFPYLNASLDDANQTIVLKRYYHIGIATDTEEGLIVPVVKNADQKSILQLAAEIADLVERARNRRIALEDLRDGTFTLTNVGPLGGLFST
ncbi:MAG TPA: dihydrolipoamide acetyltransferase family protein, partial [Bacillota bacterium]